MKPDEIFKTEQIIVHVSDKKECFCMPVTPSMDLNIEILLSYDCGEGFEVPLCKFTRAYLKNLSYFPQAVFTYHQLANVTA